VTLSVVAGTVAAGLVLGALVPRGGRRRRHPAASLAGAGGWVVARVSDVRGALVALAHPPDPLAGTTDMVVFLDAVGRGLRSGAGVHAAVRSAAPQVGVHASGLAGLVGSLDAGVPLSLALDRWRGDRPAPEVSLAAAVLGFGLATGGSVARAVDGAAATLRERLAIAGETRVLATQARASAVVVGGAPVAFTSLVVLADPRVAGVLFGSWLGAACLVVGAILEVACVAWMRRLVGRAVAW